MNSKIPWGLTAFAIVLAMVWVLIPNQAVRNKTRVVTDNIKPEERVSAEVAEKEVTQIKAKIQQNEKNYTGEMAYRHMDRLYFLRSHLRPSLAGRDRQFEHAMQSVWFLMGYSANIRNEADRHDSRVGKTFGQLRDSSPHSWLDFEQVTTEWNFRPLADYWARTYPFTILFAVLFFVCLIMGRGLNLWVELLMPVRLIMASIFWPVAWLFYPTRDAAHQLVQAMRWASYALSMAISICGANLCRAQQIGKDEVIKKQGKSLQIFVPARPLAISGPPNPKPSTGTTYKLDLFGDVRHDRQALLTVSRGKFVFFTQNRQTADRKSAFSYLSIGPKFKPLPYLTVTTTIGPQWTYEKRAFDRLVWFTNAVWNKGQFSFSTVNRWSFGLDGKSPFAHRHVQNVRGLPGFPSWLALTGEESYGGRKWKEWFFGPTVSVGKLFRIKGFFGNLNLFPMWDAAKGNIDIRLGYTRTF